MKNETLYSAAQEAFEFNPLVNELHVTSDLQCFPAQSDAVNHARNLEIKTIEVFKRDLEDDDLDDDDDQDQKISKPLTAESLIALINEAGDEESLNALLEGDQRKTVIAAGVKRLALIKQQETDRLALKADEATRQRLAANPGGQEESTTGGNGSGSDSENQA